MKLTGSHCVSLARVGCSTMVGIRFAHQARGKWLTSHFGLHRSSWKMPVSGIRYCSASTTHYWQPEPLKWSYSQGFTDCPVIGSTVGKLLQQQVEKHPDVLSVVFPTTSDRLSFAELLEESDQLASGLMSLGVQEGDRVGIWAPNIKEWVITQYGTAGAGMILVNINPAYQAPELEYALRKVGVKALIMNDSFKTQDYYKILSSICPELEQSAGGPVQCNKLPDLKHVIVTGDKEFVGTLKYQDIINAGNNELRREILDMQDKLQFDKPINIQFTSGTTGKPKGATLTHHNIINNAFFTGRRLGYDVHKATICCPPPLYHCMGMVLGSLQVAVHGSTIVYPSGSFQAETTLQAVQDEKCTSLYGTPTMFIDMLHLPNFADFDLSSLYTGIMAGSPCPIEVMRRVVSDMNMVDVTIAYGTTETSPVTFQSFMDDPLEKRVSTVGKAHPHTETKIVNTNDEIVRIGEMGELCTRGYSTMLNYWNDPEKTAQVIGTDRWYRSGDLGYMDEEGFLTITGRMKDMVIRGGENIYPTEIEQFLYKHPKIADVQVIGVPDERLGEELCAWVKLKDGESATEQEIKDFCKGKLSHFKIPKYVMFVSEFPLTVTGKVQKFKMVEEALKILGLEK